MLRKSAVIVFALKIVKMWGNVWLHGNGHLLLLSSLPCCVANMDSDHVQSSLPGKGN